VQHGDGVGVGDRHLLDLHAALGREHAQVQLVRAVQGEAGVVLLGDVRGVLDPQPLDHVALDVEAEDVAGVQPGLVRVRGQLDAARLAAAPDLHLRLDDDRVAGGVGLHDRLVHRVGHPSR
jgi:O-succinylbenzoate synthase